MYWHASWCSNSILWLWWSCLRLGADLVWASVWSHWCYTWMGVQSVVNSLVYIYVLKNNDEQMTYLLWDSNERCWMTDIFFCPIVLKGWLCSFFDLMTPCEVAMRCSPLPESLQCRIPVANEAASFATSCLQCVVTYTDYPNSANSNTVFYLDILPYAESQS